MAADAAFSSPGRISRAEALADLRRVQAAGQVPQALDSLAAPLIVLNARRQVIFANRAFQDFARGASIDEICGSRPGDVFGCVHAHHGCGDWEGCGFCGARQAIGETQTTGQPAARECHITVNAPESKPARDLLVRTTPFEIGGSQYVMVSFSDISDLKRRSALERIFFHDILNTASSFRVYLDLLRREGTTEDGKRNLLERLTAVCDTLQEEIEGQKIMLSAENGTLRAQRNLMESHSLALQLARQAEGLEIAQGRTVAIAPFSERFSFVSDDALVKRILVNMLKNALEASPPGVIVTIGLRRTGEAAAEFSVHNPSCMNREVQLQVFRRYFSTKGADRGLGTWGMKLLAEEYLGGRVAFTSTPRDGTTFTLSLPLNPSER
jgi:nitrogen fixation/metabolism regulation signal transduction histidine kinase